MTADVVTGEAVVLDVRIAHWPSRMLGFLIDAAVLYLLTIVLTLITAQIVSGADDDFAGAVFIVVLVFVFVGTPIAIETLWHGRSLGKATLGLRVVRDDGGPERFRHAAVRAILMPLEFWGPALLVSILSKRGKRLGDLLAGTIVVQTRVPRGTPTMPIMMPPQLANWAHMADLSRVSDELAMACRQFVARQYDFNESAREAMGRDLVASLQHVVTPPPPPGTPGWAYLSAVLAERRRRDEWRLHAARQSQQPPARPAPQAAQPTAAPPPPLPPSSSGPFTPPA